MNDAMNKNNESHKRVVASVWGVAVSVIVGSIWFFTYVDGKFAAIESVIIQQTKELRNMHVQQDKNRSVKFTEIVHGVEELSVVLTDNLKDQLSTSLDDLNHRIGYIQGKVDAHTALQPDAQ